MLSARVVVVRSLCGPSVVDRYAAVGVKALCPMYSREVRHARRLEIKSYPLFSGYVFAWAEDDELRRLLSVRDTVDVLRRVGNARAMGIVPDRVLETLGIPRLREEFKSGDRVQIARGKWEGFEAVCSRTEDERVYLLFQMLGKEFEMPFHKSQLRKTQAGVT